MRKTLLALPFALLAQVATAQMLVIPAGQVGSSSIGTTATWSTSARRFQNIYDSSIFTSANVTGPITISRLRFRQADGVISTGGNVWTNVTVQMSSSYNNYLTPSSTFATNRGFDNTVVFFGTVTALPANGSTPNAYAIDLQLSTPFTYNPTLGLDLVIEVDHSFGSPITGFGAMGASSSNSAHLARRIASTGQASSSGAITDQASVVLLDFTGPGGYGNLSIGTTQIYGDGCYRRTSSYYESFSTAAAFDLGGSTTAANIVTMLPTGPYGYNVIQTSGVITPPTSTPVLSNAAVPGPLGDDDFSAPQTLPFTLVHPGGSTNTIHIAANGYIQLGGTAPAAGAASDYSPSVGEFLGQTARLSPMWHDWHCSRNVNTNPGAGVYYDVDPSNTRVYVTWQEIGEYAQATAGLSVSTMQVMLDISGTIEFRYGAMGAAATTTNLCGYSRGLLSGTAASDPFTRDISTTMPFVVQGPDGNPLSLSATRPVAGTTMVYTTGNIPTLPTPPFLGGTILSFGQINPGVDLGFLGAPGCRQYVVPSGGATVVFLPGGATSATVPLAIPGGSGYLGLQIWAQSFALHPTANPLGVLLTNGLAAQIGAF